MLSFYFPLFWILLWQNRRLCFIEIHWPLRPGLGVVSFRMVKRVVTPHPDWEPLMQRVHMYLRSIRVTVPSTWNCLWFVSQQLWNSVEFPNPTSFHHQIISHIWNWLWCLYGLTIWWYHERILLIMSLSSAHIFKLSLFIALCHGHFVCLVSFVLCDFMWGFFFTSIAGMTHYNVNFQNPRGVYVCWLYSGCDECQPKLYMQTIYHQLLYSLSEIKYHFVLTLCFSLIQRHFVFFLNI